MPVLRGKGAGPGDRAVAGAGGITAGAPAVRPAARGAVELAGRRVPPTEVAERTGNSVKVLLTVYAKCLAGQADAYNERIAALLRS